MRRASRQAGGELVVDEKAFARMYDPAAFANRVRRARLSRPSLRKDGEPLGVNELDKLAGLAVGQTSRLENGVNHRITLETAVRICVALRIRLQWAVFGELPKHDLSGGDMGEGGDESGVRETPRKASGGGS